MKISWNNIDDFKLTKFGNFRRSSSDAVRVLMEGDGIGWVLTKFH